MKRSLRLVLCLLVSSSTYASAADAQKREAQTEGMEREARSLFAAATSAYEEGRYASALEYFQRAYELSSHPELLFNMAAAADRLRRDEDALDWYRQYLEQSPDSRNAIEVEARIAVLERTLAERQAAASEVGPAATEPDAPVDEPEPEPVAPIESEEMSDEGSSRTWTPQLTIGVALGGAGLASLVVGAATGARALALDSELVGRCDGACSESDRADLERRDRLAAASTATLVAGGALTAAGVVFIVLHATRAKDRPRDLAVVPVLGPAMTGASGRWSF